MSEYVLRDCKLWLAGFDLSGDINALALDYGAELVDATTFAHDTRVRMGGLKTVAVNHEGLWEGGAGKVDEVLFNRVGLKDEVMTIAPESGADGETAFSFRSALSQYSPGGQVGELFSFSVSGEGSGTLVRGTVMHNGTQTETGYGTARQLGAVTAGQKLYAILHVIAASGSSPTLDVSIESDDATGFSGSAKQISFAQATATGAQWATPVGGAIADDWWRIAYTIGGTTPSFTFIVLIGIQ